MGHSGVTVAVVVSLLVCGALVDARLPGNTDSLSDNSVASAASKPEARNVLADLAAQMVSRTASNSQVLSLNLTNLLILLVLKALLFGAGVFSFGLLGKHHGRDLSATSSALPSEQELLLMLAFLSGEAEGDFGCLHRVACEDPTQAGQYAGAASMLLKAAKSFSNAVEYDPHYESVVSGLKEAAEYGRSGQRCEERYKCAKELQKPQV